ncbi:hypothetical protein LZ31DRAFT_536314 [Colletotrichum somersetense]|nr:hypothetical protein LZ31DRAFT_536314 [Colletotrichum somersetense]
MMNSLSEHLEASRLLWDLVSCFYGRGIGIEEVYCVPLTEQHNDHIVEISYTIRYPEMKEDGRWSIRQTGIYHKLNRSTSQTCFILFSPSPDSKGHQQAERYIRSLRDVSTVDPFWLHKTLFRTYLPAWRLYNASLERKFLPIADNAVTTFIEELSDSEYRHLTELARLQTRFLQLSVITNAARDVLEALSVICNECSPCSPDVQSWAAESLIQFKQDYRRLGTDLRSAEYLQKRVQITLELLSNTLSFREQIDAKSQNENIFKLNKSAVFITTLTLLYLPPSFVATFFGMNFFDLDQGTDRIVGTSMIWIYVLCSVVLTACTIGVYHVLLDRSILQKLGNKFSWLRHQKASPNQSERSEMTDSQHMEV